MNEYKRFKSFYENKAIKSIANKKKWTVSSTKQVGKIRSKMPLDVVEFLNTGKISGAKFFNENSLVDLNTLIKELSNENRYTANNTFYLDTKEDDLIVLDIEPSCPKDLKEKLIHMKALYKEKSMSGKGYHLVFKKPKNFNDYITATKKAAVSDSNGYYEILIKHYVTFTRNTIETEYENDYTIEELWDELAPNAKNMKRTYFDMSEEKPKIELEDLIMTSLINKEYKKTPKDFRRKDGSYDMSKYEFGLLGFYYYTLENILDLAYFKKQHKYTKEEKTWIIYEIARKKLKYRPKHDELREDLPWLLWYSKLVVESSVYEENKKQKKRNDIDHHLGIIANISDVNSKK